MCAQSARAESKGVTFLDSRCLTAWVLAAVSVTASACEASDGGADRVLWYVTRVGGWGEAPGRAMGLVLVVLLINGAIVSAILSVATRNGWWVSIKRRWKVIGALTAALQVVDRLNAFVCVVVGFLIVKAIGVQGEAWVGLGLMIGMCLNLLCSGVAMGVAIWKMLGRSSVVGKRRAMASVAGGVFANPAWSMLLWFIE